MYIWAEGARYEGEYKEDKKNGRGVQTWPSGARCFSAPPTPPSFCKGCALAGLVLMLCLAGTRESMWTLCKRAMV